MRKIVRRVRGRAMLAALLTAGAGCTGAGGDAAAVAGAVGRTHVDSIHPVGEEISRFRAQVGGTDSLRGGASSRAELVTRFMAALEAGDEAALAALRLAPDEFIDLYYPHTRFTRRPYELPPQLVWLQLENYGSKGLTRALERFGERPLGFRGYTCEREAQEGPNRIAGSCSVELAAGAGATRSVRLFGPILERDGTFKFISYANGL